MSGDAWVQFPGIERVSIIFEAPGVSIINSARATGRFFTYREAFCSLFFPPSRPVPVRRGAFGVTLLSGSMRSLADARIVSFCAYVRISEIQLVWFMVCTTCDL